MVQRMVQLIGDAYSTSGGVQVQVTFNSVEVINGTVTTKIVDVLPVAADFASGVLPADDQVLGQFETTTDVTGNIPVTISVTGGTLFFVHFLMNYTGYTRIRQQTDPDVPININDPSTYTWVITTYPDSFYSDPNFDTIESDGVVNLKLNSQTWDYRTNVNESNYGNWTYPVTNGNTITFDFFVDPAKVILVAPTE